MRVLAHPLRQQLLIMLHKHGVSSPRELAERSGERLPNVSYHMRVLRDAGCIELVRTEPRRGAIEHFYRASARPILDDAQWAQLPISVRRALFGQTLRELWDDVLAAANTGGFDDPQAHVSRTWFQLDEIAWNELVDVMAGVLDKAFELHAAVRGATRPRRRPGERAAGSRWACCCSSVPRRRRRSRSRRSARRPARASAAPGHASSARICSSRRRARWRRTFTVPSGIDTAPAIRRVRLIVAIAARDQLAVDRGELGDGGGDGEALDRLVGARRLGRVVARGHGRRAPARGQPGGLALADAAQPRPRPGGVVALVAHAPRAHRGFLRDVLRVLARRRPADGLTLTEADDRDPVPVARW